MCVHARYMYTVYEVQVARRPGVQYIVYRYTGLDTLDSVDRVVRA